MKNTLLLLMLLPAQAHAHPGDHHGGFLSAITHLLSEPDHFALLVVAVVGAVWLAVSKYRKSS